MRSLSAARPATEAKAGWKPQMNPERLRRNRTQDKEEKPRMNANLREERPGRPDHEPRVQCSIRYSRCFATLAVTGSGLF